MKKTLENLRKEIDVIDDELLKIIAKRMDVVREIGKLKKEKNIHPLDEKRWQEVLTRIKVTAINHKIPQELVEKVYEEIHKESLKIEK